MKKAVVTGGSGYFGTLLCNQLIDQGWYVKNIDINPPDSFHNNYEFVQGDIRDLSKIEDSFNGVDTIFHNVALVPITKSNDYEATNLLGTKNTVDLAIKKKVKSFVYTSSSAVFGVPKKNPVSEHDLPNPAESYGKSKLDAEFLLSTYSKSIDINIVRPRTILGHGRLGIFQILFDWIKKGWNIPVLGSGDNIYQFVHADDLASACILASESSGLNFYNVGSQDYCSMRETLETLCAHANTGSKVISLPSSTFELLMNISAKLKLSPLGPYHALMYGRSLYFDTKKVSYELNWKSNYSNKTAIIDSYDHYLRELNNISHKEFKSPHTSPMKQGVLKLLGLSLNIF